VGPSNVCQQNARGWVGCGHKLSLDRRRDNKYAQFSIWTLFHA
jgi:hypothetical protein